MSDISHIQVDNTVYDLKDNVARETKAPLASPSLTGNPTAPTQSEGDNSTKLATTAYVDRGLSNKENTIIQTSTGPIAHFEDGLDVNMLDVKCAIEPVQDLHGYDHPWVGGAGKNLYNSADAVADYRVVTTTGELEAQTGLHASGFIPVVSGQQYTINFTYVSSADYGMAFYNSSKTYVSGQKQGTNGSSLNPFTFTVPEGVSYCRISSEDSRISITAIQVEKGSTATSYAPYSNICPITGWTGANVMRTGVNIWDEEWETGYYWNGGINQNTSYGRSKNYIPVVSGETYRLIGLTSEGRVEFYNAEKTYMDYASCNNATFTVPIGAKFIRFYNPIASFSGNISINYPSTDTAYHAYNGTTYPVSFGSAGTVYGGSLDVTTGVLTVDRVTEQLSNLHSYGGESISWVYDSGNNVFSTNRVVVPAGSYGDMPGMLSSCYKIGTYGWLSSHSDTDFILYPHPGGSLIIRDSRFTDVTALMNAVGNETLCYELVTPITYQLTPAEVRTILGVNNIWADTGDTTAKYWKNSDIANYIDNHKAVLEQMTGYKRYGVKGVGQAASALTRTYDAVGMEANIGSKTLKVNNDFDNAPPFHRRKCVGYWEKNLAHEKRAVFHVLKYEGDDGYTEDGTMGDYVAVECPRCYYKLDGDELIISAHRYDGYRAFDIFCHEHNQNDTMEYYYMPAYPLAMKDGHAVSLPGLRNEQGDWATLYNKTKTYNNSDIAQLAQLMPAAVNFYEWALMTVEFATQNIQDIMYGVAECYNGESKSGQFTSLENTITFECNDNLTGIIAGDYIGIGNYSGGTDYRTYTSHKVLSATSYNSKRILTLEETGWSNIEYNSTSTYYISGRHVPTGLTEDILTPSGVENHTATASHNAMRYRYHENCYGNQYHTSADLFNVAMIIPNATTTSVSVKYGASLDWYYLPDPTSITTATNPTDNTTSLSSDDRFVKLGVFTPSENYASGYIVSKKYDLDYPDIWIPNVTENGSASTYFADYASLVNSPLCRSCRFGGYWHSGTNTGPLHLHANIASSNAFAHYGGDLYFPQ